MRQTFNVRSNSALYFLIFIGIWIFPAIAKLNPLLAAEKIKLIYGPFNGNISVHSLKTYADTGELTREFRLYAKFIDRDTLTKLRYWLQKSFSSDRVELYKYSQTTEGEKLLQDLGTAVKTHPERNGFYAIRSALIEAAAAPGSTEGWTVIDVMQKFPANDVRIDTRKLFELNKFWQESEATIKLN
ncbi:alpha/beta hydrolase [Myxosarcina sp. GI1]|uniref:alpha/beta hydrolase n=1 Tax=Myxosarcina sp. GI1 TaxID=1541065 RepID=UPI00068D089E|nr:alpha/beta hydrolase [Myxosarcina sp. GI1]